MSYHNVLKESSMKLKHIKVGTKVVPKKVYKAQYNKPDVSTIEYYANGIVHLDNEFGVYTSDYFCENYKLYKETV